MTERIVKPFAIGAGLAILTVAMIVGLSLAVSGCTIAPSPVKAPVAGFSANDQNGGFIGFLPAHAAGQARPGHITAGAHARYEALLSAGYAKGLMLPVPGPQDGLTELPDGTWEIDAEHLVLFGQMATAFRSGAKPP